MVELSQGDKKRAAKLQQILTKLNAGEHVQNRMLRTWLTAEQYKRISEAWNEEKNRRDDWTEKPLEIAEYEEKLKRAIFLYNRAESYSHRGHRATAVKLRNQAERQFELTLEYLQEIVAADPYLQVWFDRTTAWTADGEAGIDPISIPRVITSRSLDCSGSVLIKKRSKSDVKRMVVEDALNDLINPPQPLSEEQNEDLRRKLRNLTTTRW